MGLTAIPPGMRWLAPFPMLLSRLLVVNNSVRRFVSEPHAWYVWIALAGAALITAGLHRVFDGYADGLPHMLSTDQGFIAAMAIIFGGCTTLTAVRHRTAEEKNSNSWLASTIAGNRLSSVRRLKHVLLPPLALLAIPGGLLALHSTGTATQAASIKLVAPFICGFAGIGSGLWLGTQPKRPRNAASRYVAGIRHRAGSRPDFAALRQWSVNQAQTIARPEFATRAVLLALILLPGGIGGLMVLAILAAWALFFWLVALTLSVPCCIHKAANWLGSTTMQPMDYSRALIVRPLLHHIVACSLAGGLLLTAFNASLQDTTAFLFWWLVTFMVCAGLGLITSRLGLALRGR